MNPKSALHEYKQKIDVELESYFQQKIAEYEKISPFTKKFVEDLSEFTLRGGKRFRAALIYYSYKLFGGQDEEEIIKLSLFIELIQSFLLIHDDIMDRSSLRRGGETIHKIYEDVSADEKFEDDEHFGTTMGILSGDLANQFALEIIGKSKFDPINKGKLVTLVAKEIAEVCFGQIHDILLNYNYPRGFGEEDIIKVHKYKTAIYTYRLPLFTGAILAGASQEGLDALEEYAMPSGVAFQIRDDVLGVFGDSEETGKENVGDIIEGKKTLLVTEAYKHGTDEQVHKLNQYLGKKDLTEEEANIVREIFKETGALEYSRKECEHQITTAKKALEMLKGKDAEALEFLEGIADYMIIRNV